MSLDLFVATAPDRDVYTVSRLNREARVLLEQGMPPLWIQGEISNFSAPKSGHWYFSLKDSGANVRCAMFRQRAIYSKCEPRDGLLVLARARVTLYEAKGEYQLVIDHLEEAGEGELRRQFELLKAKLQAEGLFAPERKRPLPSLPQRIGVITSSTGAAIRDILNILRRRFPAIPVLIYPVPVQGDGVARRIANAVRYASERAECDVLILARGGGSLEDLRAFNDEALARALADCRVPVVAGIGHETDFTIADFVADVRAPTPSGAAELVVPDQQQWLARWNATLQRLAGAMNRNLLRRATSQDWLAGRLRQAHPGMRLLHQAQRLDDLEQRLGSCTRRTLERAGSRLHATRLQLSRFSPLGQVRELSNRRAELHLRLRGAVEARVRAVHRRVELAMRALHAVSPLATLERGYAIVMRAADGAVLRSAAQVKPGDEIEARLAKGRITARVKDVKE
ncbi:MAG TPA: exodeoxyribonuclease VII large subunit [Steroidobacteraceae bacterium]|nr:exodeoxyribonuclease VII large subunit [Steroidobacteraceae bacterium]